MLIPTIWSQSDRELGRAQKLLRRGEYSQALSVLESGIRSHPKSVGLLLYAGVALSELGRYDDAAVSMKKAIALEPQNHAIPLMLGQVYLDAGRLDDAAKAFSQASVLSPGNELSESLRQLTAYRQGEGSALAGIENRVGYLTSSFAARLLSSLPAVPVARWFSDLPEKPSRLGVWLENLVLVRRIGSFLLKRRLRKNTLKTEKLISKGKNEAVVRLLSVECPPDELSAELRQVLRTARTRAIADLSSSKPESSQSRRGKSVARGGSVSSVKNGRTENDRDRIMSVLALRDPSDVAARRSGCEQWMTSFRQAGEPKREKTTAAHVLLELAETALRDGKHGETIDLCAKARSYTSMPDADWIEAVASLANGNMIQARRLFQRFADKEELAFRTRVQALLLASTRTPTPTGHTSRSVRP